MNNRSTPEGSKEEIDFIRRMNRDKANVDWKRLIHGDLTNYFVIHSNRKQRSLILNKLVSPKADAYVAKGIIPENYLIKGAYYLDESDIEKFRLEKVNHTGISVKIHDSYKFTILKISPSTFEKVLGDVNLGCGVSIYCQKSKDLEKNKNVLDGWGTNWHKFKQYFSFIDGINKIDDINYIESERLDTYKKIKKHSNDDLHKRITSDKKLLDYVFTGKGNFEEPYTAPWLYHNKLKKNIPTAFKITTGSGRSRGDYTIVIKP